jgi:hypothetical protein
VPALEDVLTTHACEIVERHDRRWAGRHRHPAQNAVVAAADACEMEPEEPELPEVTFTVPDGLTVEPGEEVTVVVSGDTDEVETITIDDADDLFAEDGQVWPEGTAEEAETADEADEADEAEDIALVLHVREDVEPGEYDVAFTATFTDADEVVEETITFTVDDDTPEPIPPIATYLDGVPELNAAREHLRGSGYVIVHYAFDEPVTLPDAARFHLVMPDTTVVDGDAAGQSASLAQGDPNGVLVAFDEDTFDQATVAAVSHGAVRHAEAAESSPIRNPEGSVALQPVTSPAGVTITPNLVEVDLSAGTASQARFVFDDAVTVDDGTAYRLVTADAEEHRSSDAAGGAEENEVLVTFAGEGATLGTDVAAADVRRAWIDVDAVEESSYLQAVTVAAEGATIGPDLVAVELDEEADTVTYTFDETVLGGQLAPEPGRFHLYYVDGTQVAGLAGEEPERNGAAVTVQFAEGAVDRFVSGGSASSAAVFGESGNANAADELGVEQTFAAGDTIAPVLLAVEITEEDEGFPVLFPYEVTVTYRFDRDVDIDAAGFVLYLADGTRLDLEGDLSFTCTATDDEVICESNDADDGDAVRDAVIGGIENDAVHDDDEATRTSYPDAEPVTSPAP